MKRRKKFTFIILLIALTSFVVLDNFADLGIAKTTLSYTRPVGAVFTDFGSGISGFFKNIFNVGNLQKDNSELQLKLDKSLAEIGRLDALQKENSQLKKDLSFKNTNDFDMIGARVVYFDPSNIKDTVTIGAGKNEGLKDGDIVIANGFLVGRIRDISKTTSKVMIITDPESVIAATVVGKNISGTVKGKIGNGLFMDQVPQNEKVAKGDIIATSGLGGTFPKGLLIGEIENVQQISGSIFQAIDIQPFVKINNLDNVMIIKRN
ncbi:MAG: rod shape-determining protein MreC [bacterium]